MFGVWGIKGRDRRHILLGRFAALNEALEFARRISRRPRWIAEA